jgi:hypothetical protein
MIYTQRSKKSLSTVVSYTYSRSLDDQSNGASNTAAVPLSPNVATNYAPSDFQATHVVNAGWILRLPAPLSGPMFTKSLLSNWTFGGIFNAHTGNPVNLTLAGDRSLTDERPQRPPLNVGYTQSQIYFPGPRHRIDKVENYFNLAAINGNAPLGYTNGIGRNAVYGPAFIESDWNLRKQIPLHVTQASMLDLRLEAFNVFNTPNLGPPVASISDVASTNAQNGFDTIKTTVGKNPFSNSNGRRVQIVVVFHY